MNRAFRWSTLVLAGWLGCPLQPVLALGSAPVDGPAPADGRLARGFGGGGGRAGGGGFGGGGGRDFGGRGGGGGGFSGRPQTGFQNAGGGFNRGDARPSGGWSNAINSSTARPSLDRPAGGGGTWGGGNRVGGGNWGSGTGNRYGSGAGSFNRAGTGTRNVNIAGGRQVNVNALNVSPGWARPGWGVARPWGNVGWYGGWARPPWGWWGASAAAWGIGTLASAAIINSAVNSAIDSQSSYFTVPDTDVQLLYGTVSPFGNSGVNFAATINGTTLQMSADCQAGTLNNQTPTSADAAQLLNAACQVAYGNA